MIRLSLVACALWAVAVFAQAPEPAPPPGPLTWAPAVDGVRAKLAQSLGGLQLSAFGDAFSGYDDGGHRLTRWDALELDGSGDLADTLQLAFAAVKDRQATHLGVGFLDFHPYGGTIAPRGQLWVEKGFHIQVGRFDVPFGNDWQFYASKDSVSISRPLTTDVVMDGGYNDAGLRLLGNDGTVNFNAYLLRGFLPGRLVGGRVGFTPFGDPFSLKGTRDPKVLELGISGFYDAASDWRKRQSGTAVDADLRLGPSYLRGEYVRRQQSPDLTMPGWTRHGWHLTEEVALRDLLPWPTTVFARVERMVQVGDAAPGGDDHDGRLAAGVSLTLLGIFQFKLEGQRYQATTLATRLDPAYRGNSLLAQFVVVL